MDKKEEALRQFGRRVAALRQQKNLSIGELADAAGLEFRQVEQIEEGKVNLLFTTLIALAKGLGITPEQLLRFD
jgi:transcriptional regulator with XRE-family HTH domain